MIHELNNYLWGDSTLEQIVLAYNKITLTIHNDMCERDILLECRECIGVTEIICWDEIIIDRLFAVEHIASDNAILVAAKQRYNDIAPNEFCELHICLINGVDITIICREIYLS